MSTVQEPSEIINSSDIPALNSGVGAGKKQDYKPMQILSNPIQSWKDLIVGEKYKICRLHAFIHTSKRDAGEIGTSICLESGYLVLPHRFRAIADYYVKHQPKNIYMSYIGRRGKRNAYIIHFYDDEKLIELETNLKENEIYSKGGSRGEAEQEGKIDFE